MAVRCLHFKNRRIMKKAQIIIDGEDDVKGEEKGEGKGEVAKEDSSGGKGKGVGERKERGLDQWRQGRGWGLE